MSSAWPGETLAITSIRGLRATPLKTFGARGDPSDLVGLQRTQEVPVEVEVRGRGALGAEFVHVVLADIAQTKFVAPRAPRAAQKVFVTATTRTLFESRPVAAMRSRSRAEIRVDAL